MLGVFGSQSIRRCVRVSFKVSEEREEENLQSFIVLDTNFWPFELNLSQYLHVSINVSLPTLNCLNMKIKSLSITCSIGTICINLQRLRLDDELRKVSHGNVS